MTAMRAFNSILEKPVDEGAIESLFTMLDVNQDGTVDYEELMNAFSFSN